MRNRVCSLSNYLQPIHLIAFAMYEICLRCPEVKNKSCLVALKKVTRCGEFHVEELNNFCSLFGPGW